MADLESYGVVVPVVVRRDERSFLDTHLRMGGHARAVLVLGEEGVGKTHLLDAFAADVEASGEAIVLRADTTPGPAPQLFSALIDLVQDNWDAVDIAGCGAEAAALASAVRGRLKVREILHRFDVFVDRLCDAGPVLLVADHATAAGEAVIDAFAHAFRRNRDRDLCVIVAARPGERVAEAFLESTDALILPVEPLTFDESVALVAELTDEGRALPDESVADIVAQAAGNPLFLTELTSARLSGVSGAGTVRLLLKARLDRLSPAARTIVEVASLSARPVSFRFCALVVGLDPEDRCPLVEAEDSGLLTERDGRLLFANPVVSDLAASALPVAVRRDTHRRIAGLLRLLGARADIVAHHALAGCGVGDPYALVAIETALEAAEELLGRGFPAAAADMTDRALDLDADHEREQRLLTVKGEALLFLGDTAEATRVFENVLAKGGGEDARIGLARSLQRSGRLTTALGVFESCEGSEADRGRAEVLLGLGRTAEAWELALRELDLARGSGEVPRLASALGDAALVQAVRMMPDAIPLGEEAVAVWEEAGEDSLDWPPLFALGLAYETADRYADSLAAMRRLRNWLESRGLVDVVPRVVRTETISAFLSLSWGRMEEAIAAATDVKRHRPNHEMAPIRAASAALAALRDDDTAFQRAVTFSQGALEGQATPFDRALTDWWSGIGRFMRLELDAGLAAFERAAAGFRGIGADDFLARTLPSLATASSALGRPDKAVSLAAEYRELIEGRSRPSAEADLLVLEAVEAADDVERVARLVDAARLYRKSEHRFGMLHTVMSAVIMDRSAVPTDLVDECLARCSALGIDNAVYRLARGSAFAPASDPPF